jgi:hypothetical protein
MENDSDALSLIMEKSQSLKFEMKVGSSKYPVDAFFLTYSKTPVSRPTIRGGVYFSDKMEFKIKAQVSGDLHKTLSKAMLGPNADFEKIQFLTTLEKNGTKKDIVIFANLTSYVQRGGGLELTLMVVGTDLSN